MYSSLQSFWVHTEEQMLTLVAMADDRDTLQRYLQLETERRGDYKPRQAVLDAILAKIEKCPETPQQAAERETMRKISDSYHKDPSIAEKFRIGQQREHAVFCQGIAEMQKRDEKRQQIFEALKSD